MVLSVFKRYRYRAYPTGDQVKRLARVFGCTRVVYNDVIAARKTAWRNGEPFPTAGELSRRLLTEAKRTPQRAWLAEVSSVALQQSLRDADRAYRNYFAALAKKQKNKKVGAPRFKTRRGKQSARFTGNAHLKLRQTSDGVGHINLQKVGRVRFASSRPLPSAPSSVTVILEADGRYFLSFVVQTPRSAPLPPIERVAGVDVGLTDLAAITCSDGSREKVGNPKWLRSEERRLARAQRALCRKQKGSHNREKARHRVAVLHRKVRETRLDHHHKLALRLVRENQTVALETLSIVALVRTRMGKSIHDAGWGTLQRLVEEKAIAHGRTVVRIDRWEPTSQVCSVCGVKDGIKPLHIRIWTCEACGARLDRDYNAAVNIMVAAGLAETLNACGGDVRRTLACANPSEAGTHRTDRTRAAA